MAVCQEKLLQILYQIVLIGFLDELSKRGVGSMAPRASDGCGLALNPVLEVLGHADSLKPHYLIRTDHAYAHADKLFQMEQLGFGDGGDGTDWLENRGGHWAVQAHQGSGFFPADRLSSQSKGRDVHTQFSQRRSDVGKTGCEHRDLCS